MNDEEKVRCDICNQVIHELWKIEECPRCSALTCEGCRIGGIQKICIPCHEEDE